MLGDDLPKEFQQPVSHSGWWLFAVLVLLAIVVIYYLVVTLLTRRRTVAAPEPEWTPPPARDLRGEHLAALARIERDVQVGDISARAGHQQISKTVRGYVAQVSRLPADKMVLADLRAAMRHERQAGRLADAVEVMYPPAFAADEEGRASERFPEAVRRAREVVGTWT